MNKSKLMYLLFFQTSVVLAQSSATSIDNTSELSIEMIDNAIVASLDADALSNQPTPADMLTENIEIPPEVFDEVSVINEPEPTLVDLLTPNRKETDALIALKAKITELKTQRDAFENGDEKRALRRELFERRDEKISVREQRLTLRQEKLSLKRDEIEAQLAAPDITHGKRLRLEERLINLSDREIKIDERIARLEDRKQRLDAKLLKLEQRMAQFEEQEQIANQGSL